MSQPCAVNNCKRVSRTLCHCCEQNVCRDHFNEHVDLLNSQLNPLTDDINALSDRLTAINIDKIANNSRQKLDQWRMDCHKIIDRFYEEKCHELDQCVTESIDKQRKEIADVRSKMTRLIENEETTNSDIDSLTSTIRNLEEKMNEIEHVRVQVDVHPLIIDDCLIQIGKSRVHEFDLMSLSSPYRTIERGHSSWNALTSSDRFLLVHMNSNLCLINQELSIIKELNWNHSLINEMCWSSALNCFFIMTTSGTFLFNENTMLIESVEQIGGGNCWSGTCSEKSLYLSRYAWDSSVFEFSLLPSIQLRRHWKTIDTTEQKQLVDSIVYNCGTVALVINDQSHRVKLIELRSSKNFDPFWSFGLDTIYSVTRVRCCLLSCNEWLLADWNASCLFLITNEGKLKQTFTYISKPYHTKFFGSNLLAILTDGNINFHKL